jgi:hypothetical protein
MVKYGVRSGLGERRRIGFGFRIEGHRGTG